MREQLAACMKINYETKFQKAEALEKILTKIIASEALTIAEKFNYLFVPVDPTLDISPLYTHIIGLKRKTHPIMQSLKELMNMIVEHYLNHPDVQGDLLALDTASFRNFMNASAPTGGIVLDQFFDLKKMVESLRSKKMNPNLVVRMMKECFSLNNEELKVIEDNDPKIKDWQDLIGVLTKSQDVTEQQLYEIQFLHSKRFIHYLIEIHLSHEPVYLSNSSNVTLTADWLSNPSVAIPRLFDGNGQTMATLLRFGQADQVSRMLSTLETHLFTVQDKNTFLKDLFLKKNQFGKTALCELDINVHGDLMIKTINTWIEKCYVNKDFVKSILFDTSLIGHFVHATSMTNDIKIIEFLKNLDAWVQNKWISSEELAEFLKAKQEQGHVVSHLGLKSISRAPFLNFGLQPNTREAFICLLSLMDKWVQAGMLTRNTLFDILTNCDEYSPVAMRSYELGLNSETKMLLMYNCIFVFLKKSSLNLNELLRQLNQWVEKGVLSKQQLKHLVIPPNNPDRLAKLMRYDRGTPDYLATLTGVWQWFFRWYGEGKITLAILISLFTQDNSSYASDHFLCSFKAYNSDFQQDLIQKFYCLLNHSDAPSIEQQIDAKQFKKLKKVLAKATDLNPQKIISSSTTIKKNPTKARILFHVALEFSDESIFQHVSKQEIFDALMTTPGIEAPLRRMLLQDANDASKPLGVFFNLPENKPQKLFSKLFTPDNSWGRKLREALEGVNAELLMEKQSSKRVTFDSSTKLMTDTMLTNEPISSACSSTSSEILTLPDVPSLAPVNEFEKQYKDACSLDEKVEVRDRRAAFPVL